MQARAVGLQHLVAGARAPGTGGFALACGEAEPARDAVDGVDDVAEFLAAGMVPGGHPVARQRRHRGRRAEVHQAAIHGDVGGADASVRQAQQVSRRHLPRPAREARSQLVLQRAGSAGMAFERGDGAAHAVRIRQPRQCLGAAVERRALKMRRAQERAPHQQTAALRLGSETGFPHLDGAGGDDRQRAHRAAGKFAMQDLRQQGFADAFFEVGAA